MTDQELSRQLLIHNAAEPGGPPGSTTPTEVFPAYFHPSKDSLKPGRAELLSQLSDRATYYPGPQRIGGMSQGPSLALHFPRDEKVTQPSVLTCKSSRLKRLSTSSGILLPPLHCSPAPGGRTPSELQGTSSPEIQSRNREAGMPQRPWAT